MPDVLCFSAGDADRQNGAILLQSIAGYDTILTYIKAILKARLYSRSRNGRENGSELSPFDHPYSTQRGAHDLSRQQSAASGGGGIL
jgi:hypothetical protein